VFSYYGKQRVIRCRGISLEGKQGRKRGEEEKVKRKRKRFIYLIIKRLYEILQRERFHHCKIDRINKYLLQDIVDFSPRKLLFMALDSGAVLFWLAFVLVSTETYNDKRLDSHPSALSIALSTPVTLYLLIYCDDISSVWAVYLHRYRCIILLTISGAPL
jgi:hypothetical protein